MTGPLTGLLVADFTRVLAGPYATMMLGDLGASVIKVERPGIGDDTRSWKPPIGPDGTSTYFSAVNRNKASVALDLNDAADLQRAQSLAERADVFIENFPAGALAKRGLGYDQISARNPGVIYCSISGFGTDVDLPGYDLIVQAVGGLMDITGNSAPTKTGFAIVDVLAGLQAAVGILAALHERERSGLGQRIEVTLLGSLLSGMVNQSSATAITGESPTRLGNAHPSIAPYEPYETSDQPLVIAVGNDEQFIRLCTLIGLPELAKDERFATNERRVQHRDDLRNSIEGQLQLATADQWMDKFHAARIPAGPINTIQQAMTLAQECGLDAVIDLDGVAQVANPLNFSRTPVTYRHPPPSLGQDTQALDALLGNQESG